MDVWEIAYAWSAECGSSFARLRRAFDWLKPQQLRAALAYAEMYPGEVQELVREHEALDEASASARHPYLRPTAGPGRT
jgi:uncharacterized protein (DUF433 family)